jgi:hypothetical protein
VAMSGDVERREAKRLQYGVLLPAVKVPVVDGRDGPRLLLERFMAMPIRSEAEYRAVYRLLVDELAACDRTDKRMLTAYLMVVRGLQRLGEFLPLDSPGLWGRL